MILNQKDYDELAKIYIKMIDIIFSYEHRN